MRCCWQLTLAETAEHAYEGSPYAIELRGNIAHMLISLPAHPCSRCGYLATYSTGMCAHTQRVSHTDQTQPRMSGHVTPHPILSLAAPTPSRPESLAIHHSFVPHNSGIKVTLAPRFTIVPAPPLRELELVARVQSTHLISQE